MILAKCHAGCSQAAIIAGMPIWGPDVSDREILDVLKAKKVGKQYMAPCTAFGHHDTHPSMSLKVVADKFSADVTWGDPTSVHRYRDESGRLLFEVGRWERYVDGIREKKVRPRLPGAVQCGIGDVRRVPYNLPEVIANEIILMPEGEGDCDAFAEYGLVASCNPFGACKWKDEYSPYFCGKKIVIFPDADPPGHRHAEQVATSLLPFASFIGIVELTDAKDPAQWFSLGHSEVELLDILEGVLP